MLDKGTTKQGPIDTALWLKKNGYESYFDWLESRDYTEETRQKSEDTIVKISREALSFTEIFSDATKAKIYYIKFRMYTGGNMEWKLVETPIDKKDEKIVKKGVYFRSKNYVGRAKDKLGFQV
jgi:hypothetical protein